MDVALIKEISRGSCNMKLIAALLLTTTLILLTIDTQLDIEVLSS